MMKGLKSGSMLTLLAVFVVCFSLVRGVLYASDQHYMEMNRQQVYKLADTYAGYIRILGDYYERKTKVITNNITRHPENMAWFQQQARDLSEDIPGIDTVIVKSGDKTINMYYRTGIFTAENKPTLMEAFNKVAEASRHSMDIAMSGPMTLINGEMVVVSAYPVNIFDGERRQFVYWGDCIEVLDLSEIVAEANLEELSSQGYKWRIRNLSGPASEKLDLTSDADGLQTMSDQDDRAKAFDELEPVSAVINMPDGQWVLQLVPKNGWAPARNSLEENIISFILALFVMLIVGSLMRLRQQREDMEKNATTDSLTGLGNRLAFEAALKEECSRFKGHFLLAYMDLDGFKQVNDVYGHDAGDKILQGVAHRILTVLKPEDKLFRVTGDEFLAILKPEQGGGWKKRLDTVREEVERPFELDIKNTVKVGISIGCALYPQNATTPKDLVGLGDQRMYADKNQRKEMLIKEEQNDET